MAAKPWEQRKGETDKAYEAFVIYRDLGSRRTLDSAAQLYPGSTPHSVRTFKIWSSRYKWVERSRAWDGELQKQRDTILRSDARKWERRRIAELEAAWNDVQALRVKARKMLDFPLATQTVESKDGKTITTVKPARWTMGQAALMIRLAAEIGAAIGAATAKDPHDMTDAELIGIEQAIEGG